MDLDHVADDERRRDLARILDEQSIVLDVGANRGQFALQILDAVQCRFICFEPVAEAFAGLSEVAATQPLIEPVRLAVAETPGTTSFHVTVGDTGSSLLVPLAGQSSQWATFDHDETVDVVRIDEFMESRGLDHVSLLKTDCQGADGQVIRSAGRYLSPDHIGALLVELNCHAFYEGQESLASMIDLAATSGYFLAGFYRHFNRNDWLWYADGLFLPNRAPYSTQFATASG